MFRKLSIRMALSHVLTVSALIPLLGFVLLYQLETCYYLDNLASELGGQGAMIAGLTRNDEAVWFDAMRAGQVINRLKVHTSARIMLLDGQGHLLSSSLPADHSRIGQLVEIPVVRQAVQGQPASMIGFNSDIGEHVVDVAQPVYDSQGRVIGIVWLSRSVDAIEQQLTPLRWLVIITFIITTAAALVLGLVLAHSVSVSLSRLADAITRLVPGSSPISLPEDGPDEVRRLAGSLNRLSHRLHELEVGRRELLASAVHELGRPLGAIKAAAQALENGAASDHDLAAEFSVGIVGQVDQLCLLLDDLALLGETEIHDLVLRREWLDLKELVQRQCQSYIYLMKQKEIVLVYRLDDNLPPIFADPTRLCQIVANLLHNAYKYTPDGGTITIWTTAGGPDCAYISLHVSDTGPGINPEEQSKIFTLFYRGAQQRQQGMGIGLAISQRLAEAHGGSLVVEGKPGHGATFTLRLPAGSSG